MLIPHLALLSRVTLALLWLGLAFPHAAQAEGGALPVKQPVGEQVASEPVPIASAAPAPERSKAEQLFIQGKERMAQGFYAQACAMLGESYSLDPATGCLLALALCHEREGRLASARTEYLEAAARARAEADTKRESAATARASALAKQVSTIEVLLSPDIKDYKPVVRINGHIVSPQELGARIPVDSGAAVIEASAETREPWRKTVQVPRSGSLLVMIPGLAASPKDAHGTKPAPKQAHTSQTPARLPARSQRLHDSPRNPAIKRASIALMSAGSVGLVVGGIFGLRAVVRNRASEDGCDLETCTPEAREDREAARRSGNVASGFMSAGVVLAASGLVMFLMDRRAHKQSGAQGAFQLTPWFSPAGGGASARGSF